VEADVRSTGSLELRHFTVAGLCEGIFARHAGDIRIKNKLIAIPNLERIMLAALDLSSRRGFDSTTTRALAEASGLSIGAIYNYVQSKETLSRMILGAVAHAVDHGVAPFDAGERADPRLRLRGLIRRHVLLTEAMQRWFYFAFLEVKAFDRDARGMAIAEELRTEQLIAEAIQSGIDNGSFIAGDAHVFAGLVKPLLQDWYLKRWKFRKRGITAAQYVDIVTPFVERSLNA
jgi:AcrR family transcriptional regulator